MNTLRSVRLLSRLGYQVHVFVIGRPGSIGEDLVAFSTLHHHPIGGYLSRRHFAARRKFRELISALDRPIVHAQDAYAAAFVLLLGTIPARLRVVNRRWETTGKPWLDWLNRISYVQADRIAVNAKYLVERVRAEVRPWKPTVVLTPNFVEGEIGGAGNPGTAPLRSQLGISSDAIVLASVGRLASLKRFDLLISATAALRPRYPKLHVLIAGAGSLEEELRTQVRASGLTDRVHFLGHVHQSRDVYAAADIAVLCSDREGMPNTLVEAAATGRPLVASHVGGNPDIVFPGVTGLLFPPGSTTELTKSLEILIADPIIRVRMGERAEKLVLEQFSETSYQAALCDMYSHVS